MRFNGFSSRQWSFLSSKLWVSAVGLIVFLLALVVWAPWHGHAQTTPKAPLYLQGAGHTPMAALKVPFKRGPVGPDGKVHQVAPSKTVRFPPEEDTEEVEAAKERAARGIFDITTKPSSRSLSSEELKALHWNPTKLNYPGAHAATAHSGHPGSGAKGAVRSAAGSPAHPAGDFPGIGYTGFIPPDGGVAAGQIDVVAVVNDTINVWDKNGNLLSSQNLSDFYSGLGTPAQDFLFDPSIEYDADFGRFWVLATSENDGASRSSHLLAVSASDDVTQGWLLYSFDATLNGSGGTSNWCDYPHLGMDAVAVYMTCNMFSFPASAGSFQYAKIRILTKDELVNGPCCSWWDIWDLREGFANLFHAFTIRPAIMHFSRETDGDFWINADGGGGSGSTLHVWHLTNAVNCCNGSGGPNIDEEDDSVGGYGVSPSAAQPNGATGIDSGDTRVLFATWEFGHLSVGQNIACNQGGTTDACASFTEIDTTNYGSSLSNVNDWFYSQPPGEDVYYPYVEQNSNGDKMMVYSRSDGGSVYPGAFATNIPNSGVCTQCTGGETTLQGGSGNYVRLDSNGRNRWGDYHGAAADPDFLGIWIEGEYATSFNTWATQIIPTYNSYAPIDSPSVSPLSFGNQAVFSSSGSQVVFFSNNGNATLRMTGFVNITGDSDFFLTFDDCSFAVLQKGQFCAVELAFHPNFVGFGSASLNVPDNTFFGVTSVSVSGTGVRAGTSSTISSSLNPSTFGQNVKFTAQVFSSTAGTPTGTVTFMDGASALGTGTLSGGVASLTTSGLSGGTHSITANYNGDTNFVNSVSSGLGQVVNPASSTATVSSSRNPSTFGQNVVFSSTVASGAGTPTGSVTFKDGGSAIGTGTLSGGHASFSTASLGTGAHTITAVYNGSASFLTSTSGALGQTVNQANSSTVLTASPNPASFGLSVRFTAKVAGQFGGSAHGTVTFKDGTTTLGTGSVSGGMAILNTAPTLHVGNHSITAAYSGDADLLASHSTVLTETISPAATKTAVVSSVNPSSFGQSVTLTVTVTPHFAGTPTGTVTIKNGAVTLATRTLSGGKASVTLSSLSTGNHTITAVYSGSTSFLTSTSSGLTQRVGKAVTTSTLASSPNPSKSGQTVTFQVTVSNAFAGTATGTVTIRDNSTGGTILGSPTLVSGKAKLTTSTLAVGTHSVIAHYNGDTNFTTSSSSTVSQVVTK